MIERIEALEARMEALESLATRQSEAIRSNSYLGEELAAEATRAQSRHDELLVRIAGHDRTLTDVLSRLGTRGLVVGLVAFLLHLASANLWRLQRPATPHTPHPRTEASR